MPFCCRWDCLHSTPRCFEFRQGSLQPHKDKKHLREDMVQWLRWLMGGRGDLNSNDSKKWSLYIFNPCKQYCMLGIRITLVPLIRTKLWETCHHQKIKNRKNS